MALSFYRIVGVLGFCFSLNVFGVKDIFYINVDQLHPTQIRYSSENVNDKIKKAIKQGATDKENTFFKYNEGTSIFDLNDAVPVIKTADGYYLCDGHHSVLASRVIGASTVPVFIADAYKFEAKNNPVFWEWASDRNYAYLKDLDGKNRFPADFDSLTDDPVRYFVALAARKFEKNTKYSDSTGVEYPLWVKIGKDVPFVEFRVADLLYSAGFKFNYGEEKDKSLFEQKIEEARAILVEKLKLFPDLHPLVTFKFLPEKERYDESELVKTWLENSKF